MYFEIRLFRKNKKIRAKDKNKRIDIFAVKNHRWFTIMQPIRETMIQNLEPKVLAFIENEKTDHTFSCRVYFGH